MALKGQRETTATVVSRIICAYQYGPEQDFVGALRWHFTDSEFEHIGCSGLLNWDLVP